MTDRLILLNTDKAKAFLEELVRLCRKHEVVLSGAADYSMVLEPMTEPVVGYTTEGSTFYAPPDKPKFFDLVMPKYPDEDGVVLVPEHAPSTRYQVVKGTEFP